MATVENAVLFLSSHSSRDSLAKVLHYTARIAYGYYESKGNVVQAEKVEGWRNAIGSSRRIGRFFSSLNSIPAIKSALADFGSPENPLPLALQGGMLAASAADTVYFLCDNVTFLSRHGWIDMTDATRDFWESWVGTRAWIISLGVWISWALWEYRRLTQKLGSLRNEQARAKKYDAKNLDEINHSVDTVKAELFSVKLFTLQMACDGALAFYFVAPWLWEKKGASEAIGAAGALAGAIGVYTKWPRK
eukprot:TRINITY_DN2282_c0_g1_i1.p1 TRINITY_DN2282_c0_g1~~TRINITY_DN2282_c0_g1_i1.p1  ORF type:complete len:255 (-),score=54.33 TRINITY_DN2282_c0_g1_i1:118-861(-)